MSGNSIFGLAAIAVTALFGWIASESKEETRKALGQAATARAQLAAAQVDLDRTRESLRNVNWIAGQQCRAYTK